MRAAQIGTVGVVAARTLLIHRDMAVRILGLVPVVAHAALARSNRLVCDSSSESLPKLDVAVEAQRGARAVQEADIVRRSVCRVASAALATRHWSVELRRADIRQDVGMACRAQVRPLFDEQASVLASMCHVACRALPLLEGRVLSCEPELVGLFTVAWEAKGRLGAREQSLVRTAVGAVAGSTLAAVDG
jgi:hypothetical protein